MAIDLEQPQNGLSTDVEGSKKTWKCLSLDLEVGKADNRIHAVAGVRPDTGQSLAIPRMGRNPAQALANLDELADGAEFLLGHNLIGFDLPHPVGHRPQPAAAGPAGCRHALPQPTGLPSQPLPPPCQTLPGWLPDTGTPERPGAGRQAGAGGLRQPAEGVSRSPPRAIGGLALAHHGG